MKVIVVFHFSYSLYYIRTFHKTPFALYTTQVTPLDFQGFLSLK